MDFTHVDPIARAILYEGYLLYPYRTSALKNCRPCAFGSLYPKAYSQANGGAEPWSMQIECLLRGDDDATLQGIVRFLHGGGQDQRETAEREVALPERTLHDLIQHSVRSAFSFPDDRRTSLKGWIELCAERASPSLFKVRIRVENETLVDNADPIMLSTQALLGVRRGRFLSVIDPPEDARALAEGCRNRGAWPVLVGNRDRHDMILGAPIILYDFPQIAPESPGNLFDGTEIDELLTLRILTLTDSEKQALKTDKHARALLERTEKLAYDQRLALHGTLCALFPEAKRSGFRPGDRVRLRPQGRADIFDLALAGMPATIASLEKDFEGRLFYTVTLDDDPGRDLGREGKPGHRFFFRPEELEPMPGQG